MHRIFLMVKVVACIRGAEDYTIAVSKNSKFRLAVPADPSFFFTIMPKLLLVLLPAITTKLVDASEIWPAVVVELLTSSPAMA